MPALLFGSISTLADTSEIQHGAFNDAFKKHGLDWHWDRDEYQELLRSNGGAQRIADAAAQRGEDVDAAAVHQTKSERFREMLAGVILPPRPGVLDTIAAAKQAGWKLGLVTTTSAENIAAVFKATGDKVTADDFDVVLNVTDVDKPKPDPAVYALALERLGVQTGESVAIEDNLGGVASAEAAGIARVAFPNENTASHDFGSTVVTNHLAFDDLASLIGAAAR